MSNLEVGVERSEFEYQLCPNYLSSWVLSFLICTMGDMKFITGNVIQYSNLQKKILDAVLPISATMQVKDAYKLQYHTAS